MDKIQKNPDIEKVELSVNVDQNAAIALYKKMGFKIVGTDNMILGDENNRGIYYGERNLLILSPSKEINNLQFQMPVIPRQRN